MDPEAYRRLHPRLYGAFIARHGGPNEIQLAAAEPLDAGRDALVMAPTASGKTEACLVPLLERHVPAGLADERPRVLLVSPTRALVNDLARRLVDPLAALGIGVGRWTGDHHDGGRLHPLTVLTPEALDSRLSRAADQLDRVGALVLDELHVLDGEVRGDQLRLLVQRLRALRARVGGALQVVGLSATVPSPEGVAGRYLRDPVLVSEGARRVVRARLVEGRDPSVIGATLGALARGGRRKVLAFVDTREGVEVLVRALRGLPPFGSAVLAHHGSLARQARLSAEERFRLAPAALCVSTSTMEVGLDIGDIDLIALVGPPPGVSALLQRAGRGGRRTAVNELLVFCAGRFEAQRARVLLEAQAAGRWLCDERSFHPSVLVQQALSLAGKRKGGVDPAALLHCLPADLAPAWPEPRLAGLLRAACEAGWLFQAGPGPSCRLGPKGEAAWARGQVHGNLDARRAVSVFDGLTGDMVGEVDAGAGGALGGLSLGGRSRRVLLSEGERVVATSGGGGDLPSFGGGAAARVDAALARALLEAAGLPLPCRVRLDGGETVFHGLGTGGGLLLARTMRGTKLRVRRAGALALVLDGAPFDSLPPEEAALRWPRPEQVAAVLRQDHRGLARRLGMGAFHAALPEEEQRRAVAEHCGASRVEALLGRGLPPAVEAADPALWDEAAWS